MVREEGEEDQEGKKPGGGRKRKEAGEGEEKEGENVIWRSVEGEDEEERLWLVEEILRRTLRREVGIKGVEERKGEGGDEC